MKTWGAPPAPWIEPTRLRMDSTGARQGNRARVMARYGPAVAPFQRGGGGAGSRALPRPPGNRPGPRQSSSPPRPPQRSVSGRRVVAAALPHCASCMGLKNPAGLLLRAESFTFLDQPPSGWHWLGLAPDVLSRTDWKAPPQPASVRADTTWAVVARSS